MEMEENVTLLVVKEGTTWCQRCLFISGIFIAVITIGIIIAILASHPWTYVS